MSVLYIRNKETGVFEPITTIQGEQGPMGTVEGLKYYDGFPLANGEASSGMSDLVARGDHAHPMPTAEQVGALPSTYTPPVTSVNGMTGGVSVLPAFVYDKPIVEDNENTNEYTTVVGSKLQILGGTVSGTGVSSGGTATVAITFSKPFAAVPAVFADTAHASFNKRFANAFGISATGFSIAVRNDTSASAGYSVQWMAVGPVSEEVEA